MSAMLKQKLIDIANGFTKYGLWKGGSSNLSELDDVTLTNLQTNDVLTYNGSKWVNDDNLQTQIDTLNNNLRNIHIVTKIATTNEIGLITKNQIELENVPNYNIISIFVVDGFPYGFASINGEFIRIQAPKNASLDNDALKVAVNIQVRLSIIYVDNIS